MAISEQWLGEQVEKRRVLPFKFAGQLLLNDGRNAVYWPEKDMLIVSDLHLEKGSYLGHFANPIPHYDSRRTLSDLSLLIEDYQPSTVLCLGDTFHDQNAFSRMQEGELSFLAKLLDRVPNWVWILGNHDPSLPDELGGEQVTEYQCDNIMFVHEPEQTPKPQMVGHFHPKASTKKGRLRMHGRSLVYSDNLLIMPAFGQYTGGLSTEDEAIQCLFAQTLEGFINHDGRVFPIVT